MVVLAYRFIAGRYHATPWGAHVNEGLVEWPPSPFRLLRALVATGFSRLGWTGIDGAARELFDLLAAVLPSYALPEGTASHTRHYMPPFKGTTTKVIDAFLRFPVDATLYVRYPTDLPDASKAVLASLLRAQPYLGRAEAWVDGELLELPPDGLSWTEPSNQPPGPGYERVELLAADEAPAYASWRASFVARELEKKENEEKAKASMKGKAFKALGKTEREKIEARVPADVVLALLQDTGALRKEGWSQPPGTRWVGYFRPSDALIPRVVTPPRREGEDRPTTALLALSSDTSHSDVFPPMSDAVRRLDSLHEALVRLSDSGSGPSPCFTARQNGAALLGHRHASLLPLSLGKRDDRLDHVLVYCPMGLDENARQALFRLRRTWAHNLPDLFVTLAGVGMVDGFVKTVPHIRPARQFVSVTPFVPSRFLKARGKDTLFEQVQRELEFRNLPRATSISMELSDGEWATADAARIGRRASELAVEVDGALIRPSSRFRRFRRERAERSAPVSFGLSLRLVFDEPIQGPLSLGYGSHFGLGFFAPATSAT